MKAGIMHRPTCGSEIVQQMAVDDHSTAEAEAEFLLIKLKCPHIIMVE